MHQPLPYGLHGQIDSEEDAAAVDALVRRLTNLKAASGVSSLKMARTLPGGSIAIAQDMGGVRKVIVQPPQVDPNEEKRQLPAPGGYIPMMFSGVIDNGIVQSGQPVEVRLSDSCRKRLAGYNSENLAKIPKTARLHRFVVSLSQRFFELMPSPPPLGIDFTQYANLRPTWFSGAMAEVVQIVGGYGRQDFDRLPDRPLERVRMGLPDKVMQDVRAQLGQKPPAGYTGIPSQDGQIAYDYKFNETNAVAFDSKRKPWLLRVNTRGVYAMPLPMIPATTTAAFRRHVEESGDDELQWVLEHFGGMPSGETFPAQSKNFEAWRRAGVIIKVCDVGDFYQHLMYGSAMGWTFNTRGSEGFNTCYDYDDETQISYSYAYKMRLSLGAETELPSVNDLQPGPSYQEQVSRISAYMARIYEATNTSSATDRAIRFKVARTPYSQLLARSDAAMRGSLQAEVDYWDNLVAAPIAVHSGNVNQIAKGVIGWGLSGFKFPEPFEGGCISFTSAVKPKPGVQLPRADTILAGYYVGDQLKVIKFFSDERQYTADPDTFEDCMTVGSWDYNLTEGMTGLMGSYYTSDFDERIAEADTKTNLKIFGSDLGYDSLPFFSYDEFFHRPGTIWRNRYFKHKTVMTETGGSARAVAVCMPFLERNAVLHARVDSYTGKKVTEGVALYSIADPYSYRYWTHDDIWAWRGGVAGEQAKVPVYPKDGNPVWVVQENYAPGACSDFADRGSWIPGLPADYTWLVHPNKNEWKFNGGGGPPKVKEYSDSRNEPGKSEGRLDMSVLQATRKVHDEPSNMYFMPSPDEYVGVFYRDMARVAAGQTEYANVSESAPENPKQRIFQGWCKLANHQAAHHFIGVINE